MEAEKVLPSELVQLHFCSKLAVTAALALSILKIKSRIVSTMGIKKDDLFAKLRLIKTENKMGIG